jgi:hypothetical protein
VNIQLKSEQEQFIRSQIDRGEYQTADDVYFDRNMTILIILKSGYIRLWRGFALRAEVFVCDTSNHLTFNRSKVISTIVIDNFS